MVRAAILGAFALCLACLAPKTNAGPGDIDTVCVATLGDFSYPDSFVSWPDGHSLALIHEIVRGDETTAPGGVGWSVSTLALDSCGWPDERFGPGGYRLFRFPAGATRQYVRETEEFLDPIVTTPDGGMLRVVGVRDSPFVYDYNDSLRSGVIRFGADGSIDPSFGGLSAPIAAMPPIRSEPLLPAQSGAQRIQPQVTGLTTDAQGRIYALVSQGLCWADNCGFTPGLVIRLDASGRLDPTFGDSGTLLLPRTEAYWYGGAPQVFAAREDGSLLLAGVGYVFFGEPGGRGVRIRPDLGDTSSGVLLPDGSSVWLSEARQYSGFAAARTAIRLRRLTAEGEALAGFGGVDGAVDFGDVDSSEFLDERKPAGHQIVASPDGAWLYILGEASISAQGGTRCGVVARFSAGGALDSTFGDRGLACVSADERGQLTVLADGRPRLRFSAGRMFRLHTQDVASSGLADFRPRVEHVPEEFGELQISVGRYGGKDGPLAVEYRTAAGTAGPADFQAVTGRLEWADGDISPKTIRIPLTDDAVAEEAEYFSLELLLPDAGRRVLSSAIIGIDASDGRGSISVVPAPSAAQPPVSATPAASIPNSQGGGAYGLWELALLALLGLRGFLKRSVGRRLAWPALLASVALASVSHTIQARPGDIDTSCGSGPREPKEYFNDILRRPGDGSLVLSGRFGSEVSILATDACGHIDVGFGVNGFRMLIPAKGWVSDGDSAAAPLRGGGFLMVVRAAAGVDPYPLALMRILADGAPDPAFGGEGTGISQLLPNRNGKGLVVTGLKEDAQGRIYVLVQVVWMWCEDFCYPIMSNEGAVYRYDAAGRLDTSFGGPGAGELWLEGGRAALFDVAEDGSVVVLDEGGMLHRLAPGAAQFQSRRILVALVHTAELLPDGSMMVASVGMTDRYWLHRFTAAGDPYPGFGGTLGFVESPASKSFFKVNHLLKIAVPTDGEWIYVSSPDYALPDKWPCVTVERYSSLGLPDRTFADGSACVAPFAQGDYDLRVTAEGAPQILGTSGGMIRLHTENRTSPGVADFGGDPWPKAREGVGNFVTIMRYGGRDGPLAVDYRARPGTAEASDFLPVSGRLEWADGDTSPRTVQITVLDDGSQEGDESFELLLSPPGAPAEISRRLLLTIPGNDVLAANAPTGSGGGALGWLGLAMLAALSCLYRLESILSNSGSGHLADAGGPYRALRGLRTGP